MAYDIFALENKLKKMLNEERFKHSIGVMETAKYLAKKYGANKEKAQVAGLLHDCAKAYSDEELLHLAKKYKIEIDDVLVRVPFLLHGPVAAALVEDIFGVKDEEIKRAIALHTTGDVGMTTLDKIIFLADYIEPNRDFEGVENLRQLAEVDLDIAVLRAFDNTICYVIEKELILYEKTVKARNYILMEIGSGKR
ncbi:MAG TPA: HD domain-containing protein [Clostridia bacterium]|nr:HD domain-containing protein [Clostridia bacterium]